VRKRGTSPVARIRRRGVRVHGGAWTVFAAPAEEAGGRLVVALGRTAGPSVVRSRIRRLARDAFSAFAAKHAGADLLLLARGNIAHEPRRSVRRALSDLFARSSEALGRRPAARAD
jgi:ribonuclease P protein component